MCSFRTWLLDLTMRNKEREACDKIDPITLCVYRRIFRETAGEVLLLKLVMVLKCVEKHVFHQFFFICRTEIVRLLLGVCVNVNVPHTCI